MGSGDGGGIEVVETDDIEQAVRETQAQPLPGALPVLPLKDMVAFPDTLTPLAVGRPRSIKLVNDVLSGERTIAMVASRDPELEEPGPEDVYDVGVAGVVARMLKVPDGTIRILVQATERIRLGDFVASEPYLIARIEPLPDALEPSPSWRHSPATSRPRSARSSSRSPTCLRSCSSRSPTSTTPRPSRTSSRGRCGSPPRRSRSCWRRSTSSAACAASRRSSRESSR